MFDGAVDGYARSRAAVGPNQDLTCKDTSGHAVAYADSRVDIAVETTDAGCAIEISDDGPGIPDVELDSLAAEGETPLQHSRGLGLWELKWGVDKLGGELSFETEDGTTVLIRLPDLEAA